MLFVTRSGNINKKRLRNLLVKDIIEIKQIKKKPNDFRT